MPIFESPRHVLPGTGLLLFLGLSCLIHSAFGKDVTASISARIESIEHGSASSVGVSSDILALGYMGLSFNHIKSSMPIQIGNRTSIYPFYFFAGLNIPWKISPFIEAGTDLVDQFFDSLDSSADKSEKGDEVDYYFSAGLRFPVTRRLGVSMYTKQYVFKFRPVSTGPLEKSRQTGYGLELWLYF